MKDSEIFAWLKHNNDYIHIEKDGYDVSFNVYTKDEEKRIYVAFEETQQKSDWKSNFDFPVTKYGILKVHRGFARQYDICRSKVFELAGKAISDNPEYDILCVGWSLGGALALLCSEDIGYHFGRKVRLVSFGSPKVCWDSKTVESVGFYLYRNSVEYCNINDLVPNLPPLGFRHVCRKNVGKPFSLLKFARPSSQHNIYDEILSEEGL